MLPERVAERFGVVEEDVDPDARVRAGHSRHVAERAAGRRERVVPLDARRTRVIQEDVRKHVWQVRGQRDEPIVRACFDRDRLRAERRDKAVQRAVAVGIGRGHRREKPRRVVEDLRVRVRRTARLRAADGMPADETRIAGRRLDDGALRRADVGHSRRAVRGEDVAHLRRKLRDGHRDDGELGVAELRRHLVDRAALER